MSTEIEGTLSKLVRLCELKDGTDIGQEPAWITTCALLAIRHMLVTNQPNLDMASFGEICLRGKCAFYQVMMTAEAIRFLNNEPPPEQRPVDIIREIAREEQAQRRLNRQDESLGICESYASMKKRVGWTWEDGWEVDLGPAPLKYFHELNERINQGKSSSFEQFQVRRARFEAWTLEAEHKWRRGRLSPKAKKECRDIGRIMGLTSKMCSQWIRRYGKGPSASLGVRVELAKLAMLPFAGEQDPGADLKKRAMELTEYAFSVNISGDLFQQATSEILEKRNTQALAFVAKRFDRHRYIDLRITSFARDFRKKFKKLNYETSFRILHGEEGVLCIARKPKGEEVAEFDRSPKDGPIPTTSLAWLEQHRGKKAAYRALADHPVQWLTWKPRGRRTPILAAVLEYPSEREDVEHSFEASLSAPPHTPWQTEPDMLLSWADEFALHTALIDVLPSTDFQDKFIRLGRLFGTREALCLAAFAKLMKIEDVCFHDLIPWVAARNLVGVPFSPEVRVASRQLLGKASREARSPEGPKTSIAAVIAKKMGDLLVCHEGMDWAPAISEIDTLDRAEERTFRFKAEDHDKISAMATNLFRKSTGLGRKALDFIQRNRLSDKIVDFSNVMATTRLAYDRQMLTSPDKARLPLPASDITSTSRSEEQRALMGFLLMSDLEYSAMGGMVTSRRLAGEASHMLGNDDLEHRRFDAGVTAILLWALRPSERKNMEATLQQHNPEYFTQSWSHFFRKCSLFEKEEIPVLQISELEHGVRQAEEEEGVEWTKTSFCSESYLGWLEQIYLHDRPVIITYRKNPWAFARPARMHDAYVSRESSGALPYIEVAARSIGRREQKAMKALAMAHEGAAVVLVRHEGLIKVVVTECRSGERLA